MGYDCKLSGILVNEARMEMNEAADLVKEIKAITEFQKKTAMEQIEFAKKNPRIVMEWFWFLCGKAGLC